MSNNVKESNNVGKIFKSTLSGEFKVISRLSRDKFLIRFIDTGYEKISGSKEIVNGKIRDKFLKDLPTIYGWGINDVDYDVTIYEDSSRNCIWRCPYYEDWSKMVQRCYDPKFQQKQPSYVGCKISDEWRYLSNFIKWVDSQPNRDWRNCQLDKDLLSLKEYRHYSPNTAVYIHTSLNSFITDSKKARGSCMIGVYARLTKTKGVSYRAYCNNPFKDKKLHLGSFITELEAHKAWQAKKHEYALQLADLQEDPRVADALRQRYAPYKDWTNR